MMIHAAKIRFAALLLLPLLCMASPLSAAGDVTMEPFLGFDGFFQLGSWTPLTVVLENRGPSLDGIVEVQITSGSEYYKNVSDTLYSMDVALPANSKKRCTFTIHIDNFSRPLFIRFKQGERTLLSESVNLRSHYTARPLVVAAGRGLSHDALSPIPPDVMPLAVRVRFLPETLYGYQGVRLLILDAGAIDELNDKQFEAVIQWLETGGFLMVAGEMNLGFFSKKRIAGLLPVTVTGFESLKEIRALEAFSGFPIISDTPFLALKTSVWNAEILAAENGIPILVKKSRGKGGVIFLAVDYRHPPFTQWPGITPFWETLLDMAAPAAASTGTALRDAVVVSAITEAVGFRFPNFFLVLLFIIGYVILSRLIIKRAENGQGRSNKLPALGMALLAILLCGVAYFTFLHRQSKSAARYNGFLHMRLGEGSHRANGNYIIGIYALQKTTVFFDLGKRFHPIRPIPIRNRSENHPNLMQIHESGNGQTIRTPMEAWSKNYYRLETQLDLPLKGTAFRQGDDLILDISNNASHTILDGRIYYDGRVLPIGDISPDQHLQKRFTAQMIANAEKLEASYIQFEERTYPKGFPIRLFSAVKLVLTNELMMDIHRRYRTDRNRLCLFGWMGTGVWPVQSPDHRLPGEHTAFVEWEIMVTS